MTLSALCARCALWAAVGLIAQVALAQAVNYKTVQATAGTPVELSYHASARKDCAPAPLPVVRPIEQPRSGTLIVRRGMLTTDKVAGCPKLKLPVQVVFYLANAGYQGPDHVLYEVTAEGGEDNTFDITINVKAAPAPGSASKDTGSRQP